MWAAPTPTESVMAQEAPRNPSLDLAGPVLGLLTVIVFMFLPIWLVGVAYSPEEAAALTAGAICALLGVLGWSLWRRARRRSADLRSATELPAEP